MGQLFAQNIPQLVVASTTQLTLAATNNGAPTHLQIGGQGYFLTSALTLNTGTVGINGIDTGTLAANTLYYVYAVVSSGVVGMVISLSATAPTGFTQYANIGRVRTFLGSAGLAASANWLNGQLQSAAIVEWQSYTPTLVAGGTTSTNAGRWRQSGSSMELEAYQIFTGAGAASTFGVTLPLSYSIASWMATPGSSVSVKGTADWYNGSTYFMLTAATRTSTTIQFSQTGISADFLGSSLANTHQFGMKVAIPIAEWAGLYS